MSAASAVSAVGERRRTYSPLAEQTTGIAFLVADTLALLLAYAITITLRGAVGGATLWPQFLRLMPFLGVVPLLIWMMDLYPGVLLNPVEEFRRLTLAITLGMSLVVVATFLVKESSVYSRAVLITAAPFGLALVLCGRWAVRKACCDAGWWGVPAILIGPADEVDRIRRVMETQPGVGVRPAAVVYADRTTLPLLAEEHVAGGAIPYAVVVIPSRGGPGLGAQCGTPGLGLQQDHRGSAIDGAVVVLDADAGLRRCGRFGGPAGAPAAAGETDQARHGLRAGAGRRRADPPVGRHSGGAGEARLAAGRRSTVTRESEKAGGLPRLEVQDDGRERGRDAGAVPASRPGAAERSGTLKHKLKTTRGLQGSASSCGRPASTSCRRSGT
jgi:hypothetical protein